MISHKTPNQRKGAICKKKKRKEKKGKKKKKKEWEEVKYSIITSQ